MYTSRKYTNMILDLMDDGTLDPKTLAEQLLSWSSEDSMKQFWVSYGYADFFEPQEDE
jgi:hypothetical protein